MLRPPPRHTSDLAFAPVPKPPVDTDEAAGGHGAGLAGGAPTPNLMDNNHNAAQLQLSSFRPPPRPPPEAAEEEQVEEQAGHNAALQLGSFRPPPRPPSNAAEVEQVEEQTGPGQESLEYSQMPNLMGASVQAKAQMSHFMAGGSSGNSPFPRADLASKRIGFGNLAGRRQWAQPGLAALGGSGLFRTLVGGTFRMKQPDAALTYEQFEELRRGKEKEANLDEEELDSQWFSLPSNTYGAAIWATLILHIEAIDLQLLWKAGDDDTVPFSQTWDPEGEWWRSNEFFTWFRLRLTPFLVSVFFQVSIVGLCWISFALQFSFTYLLDMRIGGSSFFDLENAPYICATPGLVQLISIGFFMCFMLGQVPAIMKNMMLIWTTDMITDQDDGVIKAKTLLYSEEWMKEEKQRLVQAGILHHESEMSDHNLIKLKRLLPAAAEAQEEMSFLLREPFNHRVRKVLASVFPLQEIMITIYLLYVGCKYIFWVGFMSLEQEPGEWFASFPLGEQGGVWPWMSETNGVEEIIMGTLALQFIMDIDEALFSFVLPRSVQASVQDTRLKCFGWLPGKFKEVDYRRLGQRSKGRNKSGGEEKRCCPWLLFHRQRDDLLGLEKIHVLETEEGKEMFQGEAVLYYRFLYDAVDTAVHSLGSKLLHLMQEREERRWELLQQARPQDVLASQGSEGGGRMSHEDKVEKELMESEEFVRKGKALFAELERQLRSDLAKPYSSDKETLQNKLLLKVEARLRAVPEHDRGMPYILNTWAHLNSKFDLHQELLAKKVRLRWLNLLPDATFLFFFTIIFVPVIIVGLVRAKVGCYEYSEVALADIPASDVSYWGGVAQLSPLMVFFVLCAGWRAVTFLLNLYRLKLETERNVRDKSKGQQLARNDSHPLTSPTSPRSPEYRR